QAKRKRNRIAAFLLIFRLGRLSLRFLACGYVGVEFLRFAFRHRKWLPVRSRKMFCQKYDLPDVITIMCDLPVDRLHYGMFFTADFDGLWQIRIAQRLKRGENRFPTAIP